MTHHFSIDPTVVLGVAANASLDEIHRAYREKSKKHHPDLGGDEWAFRIVARAYEVLKATRTMQQTHIPAPTTVQRWNGEPPNTPTDSDFRIVEVELVWIRFELMSRSEPLADNEPAATTLSVCLVISWPRASLVKRANEFPDAAEKLRRLIEVFELLHGQEHILGAHSRIEDGQFVGWLSYPNVIQAEAGFQRLQSVLLAQGMDVSLRTRDEPLPMEWLNR